MATDNPLLAESDGVERDGLGRPKIIPLVDGVPNLEGKLVAYTRASTFAKAISDSSGMTSWLVNHAVIGVAISPDLAAMAGALGTNPDDFDKAAKAELAAIVETAHDRSGGNAKANYGTAVHTLTEPGNEGYVPERMVPDVEAYAAALEALGLEAVDSERFVVHDGLKVAGTYDHRYRLTRDLCFQVTPTERIKITAGRVLMGDKKTGRLHFDEHTIQLATYARADLYDPDTGEREAHGSDILWGILAHIPAGTGKADIYAVDLSLGWQAVEMCETVRKFRSATLKKAWPLEVVEDDSGIADVPSTTEPADIEFDKAVEVLTEAFDATPIEDQVILAIREAETADILRAVWSDNRRAWTAEHTAASKARIAEIEAAA